MGRNPRNAAQAVLLSLVEVLEEAVDERPYDAVDGLSTHFGEDALGHETTPRERV
jgi:hypothetical protein